MKIGFAQFNCKFGNKKYNLNKIDELSENINSDLLVFPEMCTTGYMVKSRSELKEFSEQIPGGPTIKRLIEISSKTNKLIIVGMPEVEDDKLFSTAVAISPQGFITKHQKTHLFLKEVLCYDKGETKPRVFNWNGVMIGMGVCYDYMFPEFWRSLALKGANIFCNTANFVYDYGFKLMQARALENGVFSICVNRVGKERGQTFLGGSEIVDIRGDVLYKAGFKEETFVAEVDIDQAKNKQWNAYNNLLTDIRSDMY